MTITPSCTLSEVIAGSAGATAVLNEYGIDTCCGRSASLGAAAAHAGVEPATLIGSLMAASQDAMAASLSAVPQVASCSCGCR